ncbi:hypothetical protein [Stakelama pacifica]|uniref:Uncharacterized protein n=1 Tax=Stakelama pacifica TaxID=517720 RepID=A0A4R6FJU8_9SPHN|nr:hypothetical protein [Stakelama pacifica]TDN81746.1 hypothetical protein EV664_107148 [Stakelama pacifica]GGO96448.1 hypothetical protein GCM10011329_23000 [Stakelama pacifica]
MSGEAETVDPYSQGTRAEILGWVGGMEAFERGFNARTFSPERRARQAVEDAVSDLTSAASDIYEAGGTAEDVASWTQGYRKRWVAFQQAGARTMNWMITGPARFPVDRNQKRMDIEMRRYEELAVYRDGATKWIERSQRRAERAAIVESDEGGHPETLIGNIRVVENVTLDRLQLIFPDKPTDEERAALKKRGFRWAPSVGAWQRKLTNNARYVGTSLAKQFSPATDLTTVAHPAGGVPSGTDATGNFHHSEG